MADPFSRADLPAFFEMARQEGWICDPWEFEFLLREAPGGCRAIHRQGELAACITAIGYGRQGWIGNLMVTPAMRRQGLGRRLMEESLAWLEKKGSTVIWLTASSRGAPLYESLGFRTLDRIERWGGEGGRGRGWSDLDLRWQELLALDAAGWGGPRGALLAEKVRLGRLFSAEGGFLVRQRTPSGWQLGPGGGEPAVMPWLLERAMSGVGDGRIFLDLPAGNVAAVEALRGYGFSRCGETLLMCRGDVSGYRTDRIWALGTMGSIG
jgi:ribosomal protein S18 acetylase RimI-like enzyme